MSGNVSRYFVSLGANMVVALVSVVLLIYSIIVPHWYHSEQHPRTDIGLFYNCTTEGLDKVCHVFADNEAWVVASRVFGVASPAFMMVTVGCLVGLLFSGRRMLLVVSNITTVLAVFAWVACFIAFLCMINFDAHFEEYQSDICYTMVVVNGAVFLIAIAPMRAVRRYARGIPVPFLNVQNIVNRDNEDDVTRDLLPEHPDDQHADEAGYQSNASPPPPPYYQPNQELIVDLPSQESGDVDA